MNLRKIIFSLIAFASVVAAIYFSFITEPNYGMTGIWLTFSLFSFALGWPEIAESISFLGNNIKLREVKNAITELKQLAEVNSRAILELIQGSNRWGGFTEKERQKIYKEMEKMLVNLSFTEKEIEAIQARWHYWIEGDYIRAILNGSNTNHPEIPRERMPDWYKKRKELYKDINSISQQQLVDIFTEFNAYTPKIENAIKAFEYYKNHKEHRNLQEWENRNDWFGKI